MPDITSPHNDYAKRLKGLGRRKERQERSEILLEGTRLIGDALESGIPIIGCIYDETLASNPSMAELIEKLKRNGIACHSGTPQVVSSCCDTVTPQGIVANAAKPIQGVLGDILGGQGECGGSVVVLDGLQDPGNVGTIIRTACAAGCNAVVIGPGTVDPFGPKALRASMGAAFRVPIITCGLGDAMDVLERHSYRLYYAAGEAEFGYTRVDLTGPTAMVIGNEGAGVSEAVRGRCHAGVSIPMANGVESLNASIAASLLVYEVVRQQGDGFHKASIER